MSTTFYLDHMPTPVGEALLATDKDGALRAFDWSDYEPRMLRLMRLQNGPVELRPGRAPAKTLEAFAAYFAGRLDALSEVPWKTGGTGFQKKVWMALCAIPTGKTWSYKRLAEQIGAPAAVRAVGLANGANPVGVIVPCHRVIGANGALTGYGGGLERKQWLLSHEGAWPAT